MPFGALPYLAALIVWTAISVGSVIAAVPVLRRDWGLAATAAILPAVLMMVAYAYFVGVLGLLSVLLFRHAGKRPILGGLCLAAISVKPQFAALFGLVLVCAGH